MIRIEQWSIKSLDDPYTPPEVQNIHIAGIVYNHPNPKFKDGDEIVTSPIKSAVGKVVTTYNGHQYILGEINPNYREWLKASRPNWDPENPITVIRE